MTVTTLPRWTAAVVIDDEELPIGGNPTSDTLHALVQAGIAHAEGLIDFDEAVSLVVYKRLKGAEPVRDRSFQVYNTGRGIVAVPMGA